MNHSHYGEKKMSKGKLNREIKDNPQIPDEKVQIIRLEKEKNYRWKVIVGLFFSVYRENFGKRKEIDLLKVLYLIILWILD